VQTIKIDDFTAGDDNTDLDASASKHGLMPKTDKVKIDTVETNADVTDATNVASAGAVMADGTGNDLSGDIVFDEKADHSSTPSAGHGYLWVRNDAPSVIVFTNDIGTDTVLSDGAAYDGNITTLDIDGGTDIAADLVDADLIIVDDGAGGTNRKSAMSRVKDYATKVRTASYAADQTLTTAECNGYIIYVTGAATITLPAIADGMSVTIITIGAVAVSVDPNSSDKIWLDGTALDDGDKITNASTAGDIAVLTYYSADGWHAATNGWTDGGA
jgi:hypothetical protein